MKVPGFPPTKEIEGAEEETGEGAWSRGHFWNPSCRVDPAALFCLYSFPTPPLSLLFFFSFLPPLPTPLITPLPNSNHSSIITTSPHLPPPYPP
ncbi:hypothetical protein COCNU_10G004700 [Cocos nucifera]|uniref:Uncharacterized protein n=1 Tax=Cocos nucifera TaxID=13894 RepID=A0A8K0ILU6_COCNU|nr:hypothetical protein COCNU_10G004700 [Cocos nucifera]